MVKEVVVDNAIPSPKARRKSRKGAQPKKGNKRRAWFNTAGHYYTSVTHHFLPTRRVRLLGHIIKALPDILDTFVEVNMAGLSEKLGIDRRAVSESIHHLVRVGVLEEPRAVDGDLRDVSARTDRPKKYRVCKAIVPSTLSCVVGNPGSMSVISFKQVYKR